MEKNFDLKIGHPTKQRSLADFKRRIFSPAVNVAVIGFILSTVGTIPFAYNAWEFAKANSAWLQEMLPFFSNATLGTYLVFVTEVVGAGLGTVAVIHYIEAAINFKTCPKELLIRCGFLLFGIFAMLPTSLTSYLGILHSGSSIGLDKLIIIVATLIYGMVYGNSAFSLMSLANSNCKSETSKSQRTTYDGLFFIVAVLIASIVSGGGVMATWLGMDKIYSNFFGSTQDISSVLKTVVIGLPVCFSFLARACLFSVTIQSSLRKGWEIIMRRNFGRLTPGRIHSTLIQLAIVLFISLPGTACNLTVVETGRIVSNALVSVLFNSIVTPITVLATTLLYQVYVVEIGNRIVAFINNRNPHMSSKK